MTVERNNRYFDFLAALVAFNFASDELSKALSAKNATIAEMRAAAAIMEERRAAYQAIREAA